MSKHPTLRVIAHIGVLCLGWLLLLAGIGALFLPGPGMLMLFAGIYLLSRHHRWARYLLRPVKLNAMIGAAEGVETRLRIALSSLGALCVGALGALWLVQPPAPSWWPAPDDWWLLGGRTVGVTLTLSCVIALILLFFSARRFHGHPDEVAELRAMLRARSRAVATIRERRRQHRLEHRQQRTRAQ